MIYGTSYFPTRQDALKYYTALRLSSYEIMLKFENGEIHIGKPPGLNSLRRAVIHLDQGSSRRYYIHEDVRIG